MAIRPKCMKFCIEHPIFLSNKIITYVKTQKYLGVCISSNMEDDQDLHNQTRNVYGRGNTVIKNFRTCSEDTKVQLFKSYCTSFYCTPLWNRYRCDSFRRLKVAYNRIFRTLFGLESRVSISSELVKRKMNPFNVILRKNVVSFKQRLLNSNNSLIKCILESLFFTFSRLTCMWDKMIYVLK